MIDNLTNELAPTRERLVYHKLYENLETIEDLKTFMQMHVFAVWDFMSLLKALQQQLTCTTLPWLPTGNPKTRRFINEIVLGEESDEDAKGNPMSHYEMYLEAMVQLGAETKEIKNFERLLKNGDSVAIALNQLSINQSIKDFVNFTFEVIANQKSHIIAAVFTFGREDLIPDMFIGLVKGMSQYEKTEKLVYYLERHIELDGDEHGPLSLQMIEELCGTDHEKWTEAYSFSKKALQLRIALWDAINASISKNTPVLT